MKRTKAATVAAAVTAVVAAAALAVLAALKASEALAMKSIHGRSMQQVYRPKINPQHKQVNSGDGHQHGPTAGILSRQV